MGRLLIILLLTHLALIFTTAAVEFSSSDELPWPPVTHTKLHVSLHTKPNPPNETTVEVVSPTDTDFPFNFGQVNVFDELLIIGAISSSLNLGRCQGMYIMSDQHTLAGLTSMSIVLYDEIYIMSTLMLLGRYEFTSIVNDLPIVGGTGYFNYAQGVCQLRNFRGLPEPIYVVDCDIYHRPTPYQ